MDYLDNKIKIFENNKIKIFENNKIKKNKN